MKFVVYITPNFTENAVLFLNKLASLTFIKLGVISQEPVESLPFVLRSQLFAFYRVGNILEETELEQAAISLKNKYGTIHRLFGAVEQIQIQIAGVREKLGIEGMTVDQITNFRDKSRMKTLLQEAGIPCARHKRTNSETAALKFAGQVGFPLIVKPPDGAASQSTFQVKNADELHSALRVFLNNKSNDFLLEEFIEGQEGSFDTFTIKGKPVFHSLTQYYPNPLHVVRNSWIQWQVVLPREIEEPGFNDIKAAAFQTLKVLRMGTGMTHLEWFRRKDGTIAISEVAARPPGAQIMTLISRANDVDAVTLWGKLMIFEEFPQIERKYAAGAAYLRGLGEGRVAGLEGIEEIKRDIGYLVTDYRLPKIGQEKSISYEGEGFIIVRHPKTEMVKSALDKIVSSVRVILTK